MIDSHAHLTAKAYRRDLAGVLRRAREAGVTAIINAGFDIPSSREGIRLASINETLFAAVGVHPHDARTLDDDGLAELENLAGSPKVVAIGEIGLDFYRNLSPRLMQERAFRRQIRLARKKNLPIIVHDRDAHHRTMEILKDECVSSGVLHCFSGDISMARQAIEMGLHVSFAGPITYDGKLVREMLRHLPVDRILVETDCPYLAPVPYRGKRNEPAYVRLVVERVAEILGESTEQIDRVTEQNTRTLFHLA